MCIYLHLVRKMAVVTFFFLYVIMSGVKRNICGRWKNKFSFKKYVVVYNVTGISFKILSLFDLPYGIT